MLVVMLAIHSTCKLEVATGIVLIVNVHYIHIRQSIAKEV